MMKLAWKSRHVGSMSIVLMLFIVGSASKPAADTVKHYNLHYKTTLGEDVDEIIDNSEEDNTQIFHVSSVYGQNLVLRDYNRGIQVYTGAQVGGGEEPCFVSPLNKSNGLTPKEMNEEMAGKENSVVEVDSIQKSYYTSATEPIPDPSFLGPKATSLCNERAIYWLFPRLFPIVEQVNRVKRSEGGVIIIIIT